MSLINDALKKAQRERGGVARAPTAEGMGAAGANPPVSQTGSRAPGPDPRTRLLALGGGAVALIAVAIAAVAWWPRAATPTGPAGAPVRPVATTAIVKGNAVPPSPPIALPIIAAAPARESTPPPNEAEIAPIETAGPTVSPPVTDIQPATNRVPIVAAPPEPGPAGVPATTPAQIAPANPRAPLAAAPGPPQRNPQIETLIDGLHVTAIKPSATAPRAMWDDRVFKLGDMVDRASGLRITQISASQLTFTDANGFEYVKKL